VIYIYIVSLSENNKAGLFNSIHNRIKQFYLNDRKIEVFNIQFYDSLFLKYFKKITGVNVEKSKLDFLHEDIKYNTLNIRRGLLAVLADKLHLQYFSYLFYAIAVKKKFKKADLISAQWGLSPGLLAYWLKKILNKKYVVTYHGSDIHTIPQKFKGWNRSLSLTLKNSDGNIFVSNNLYKQATEIGEINNPTVIYNGVDKSIFKKTSFNEINLRKKTHNLSGKVIGFVGSLVEIKNAEILPDIFLKIKNILKIDCTFIIIGDGVLREKIEDDLLKLNLKVVLTGNLPVSQVSILMTCMDLLVLPSKNEGFGMVLLEALMCGSKCIGSRIGGITELIGKENTVELDSDFIDSFSQLASNKLLNKQNKSEKNINILSWEDVYDQEINFYNKIKLIK
jgi:glycosyltransferase involved in cell wall biosynthesis